jgi:hypothetical protein
MAYHTLHHREHVRMTAEQAELDNHKQHVGESIER